MSNFNSINDFYKDMIEDLGIALRDTLENVKTHAIEYIITNWYSKYPQGDRENTYNRLGLMLESLQSKYELQGNNLIAYLYIKNDSLHPSSNSWNENPITYEELYQWFSSYYGEQDILENAQEYIDESKILVNIIRDTLKSKGYDFQ